MAPTPPSTSSSVDGNSPSNNYRVVRKRNRVPLSCAPCRARKLKCNRTTPCEKCVKRGDAASCTFAPGRKKTSSSSGDSPNSDEMQNRIDRLEGLVLSLVSNGGGNMSKNGIRALSTSESAGSSEYQYNQSDPDMIREEDEDEEEGDDDESEVEQVSKSMGMLKVMDKTQTHYYVGEAHWAAVLKDITELKEYYNQKHVQKEFQEQIDKVEAFQNETGSSGPLLFRGVGSVPSPEILAASMPHRGVVDRLIARYFQGSDCSSNLLHRPTFWKQYDQYWQDPTKTDLTFVGLLYAIMTLSLQSYDRIGDAPSDFLGKENQKADEYRTRTVQCLVASNYSKPTPKILLTLYLYSLGEYCKTRDTSFGLWLLMGMIVRSAMRMGYHRDVSAFPGVTAFDGEMRTRLWSAIFRSDLLFSFQIGLPSMVTASGIDQRIPRNLNDEDFGEDSDSLPPSRPVEESTQMSYYIAITKMAHLFRRIVDNANLSSACSLETVLRLDGDLQAERAQLPTFLRVKSLADSRRDPPVLVMQRFNLDMLYYKARIVLHRRYLGSSQHNSKHIYSRNVCIDSAFELLDYQAILHAETKPNGLLQSASWFLASLTMNDYLLAGVIMCLDLYYQAEALLTKNPTYNYDEERCKRELKMCIRAREIWGERIESSIEAFKAVKTIDVMIHQVTKHCPDYMRKKVFGTGDIPTPGSSADLPDSAQAKPEQDAAMTLGMLSGGLTPNSAALYDRQYVTTPGGNNVAMAESAGNIGSPFGGDFGNFAFGNPGSLNDVSMNLDLEAWDSYLQSANFDALGQGFPGMDISEPAFPGGFGAPQAPVKPDGQQQSKPQGQQTMTSQPSNDFFVNGAGVFMGVQTPPSTGNGL